MKKMFAFALVLTLLLAGCTNFDDRDDSAFDPQVTQKEEDKTVENEDVKPSFSTTTTTTNSQDELAKEMERFRNMSSAQIEKEIFAKAETIYRCFDGLEHLDTEPEQTITKGNDEYAKVQKRQSFLDPNVDFSNFAAFKTYLQSIFSVKFTQQLLKSDTIYINHNGATYQLPCGRGSSLFYQGCTYACTAVDTKKGIVTYQVYAKTLKDEYMDMLWEEGDNAITNDMLTTETYTFQRIKENGNWVFTNFELWY